MFLSMCLFYSCDPFWQTLSTACCFGLRLAALVKDYCGSLSEKSVQMNFALIYELLDEMVVSLSVMTPQTAPLAWQRDAFV